MYLFVHRKRNGNRIHKKIKISLEQKFKTMYNENSNFYLAEHTAEKEKQQTGIHSKTLKNDKD